MNHTIAAISTPSGSTGLGVVRLSGPQAMAIAGRVFRPQNPDKTPDRLAGYTAAYDQHIAFDIVSKHLCPPLSGIRGERLEKSLALIVGNDLDGVSGAHRLTVEAVLAVVHIQKQRLFVFGIPADNVNKAGLVAKSAAHA